MEIYVEGQKVDKLPCLTREDRLRYLNERCLKFWGTPLYNFWRNAYISFRDRKKKAGKLTAISNPASDNHDDFPAA